MIVPLVGGKVIIIMKSYRPDLDMAVSFLTTRISNSDVDDWENLEGY